MGILLLSFIFVAVLGFTLSYFLFKKLQPARAPCSNPLYWLSSLVLTPILLVASIYAYLYLSSRYEEKPFNQSTWMDQRNERYIIVDDLVENKLLIGLDSAGVTTLLGEVDYIEESTFMYNIGYDPKQYINLDPDWLEVEFKEGQVVDARVKF